MYFISPTAVNKYDKIDKSASPEALLCFLLSVLIYDLCRFLHRFGKEDMLCLLRFPEAFPDHGFYILFHGFMVPVDPQKDTGMTVYLQPGLGHDFRDLLECPRTAGQGDVGSA